MSNGLINRQYVGARYVPKIMGEWNKALQYEALSVVTYMGNSFTSKVPVPANIDITNENYWANTGNYNAQVEEYRNEVKEYKKYVNSIAVTPEMFGAKGDGTTDDTNAIQSAINAGDIISFSDKTYNITNNINISGTKKIMGNGATITTNMIPNLETNTNLIYAFTITNGYNVVIDNFNFTKVFTGIRTINCNGLTITNINLSTKRFAIELNSVFNFIVSHIYIEQEQRNIDEVIGNFAWTDGIHLYGNSSNGVIEHIYGTTCDDMISLTTDEGTTNYGSKGDIKNITIRDIKTVTKNILTDNTIIYKDASFNIIKLSSSNIYNYNFDNITIENVNGKSFYSGGIIVSCLSKDSNTHNNITIKNCNIEKIYSNHNNVNTISFLGRIDNLIIENSKFKIGDNSNNCAMSFYNLTANYINISNCELIDSNTTETANYAFTVDGLTCDNFIISKCHIDNFYGYCNGYSALHSTTFNINNYNMNNCYIKLRGIDDTYVNHTLCIFATDTSFHGKYNNISNVTCISNTSLIYLGNTNNIESININNIITKNDYNKYAIFISNNSGNNYNVTVNNFLQNNQSPIVLSTNEKIRLVTHSSLLNTAPGAFEKTAKTGDIIETSNGIYYFNGSNFVTLN